MKWIAGLCLLLSFISLPAQSAQLRVAVASNFLATANAISQAFEDKHNTKVLLSSGSTGKHFAQIAQGAPFDVFLAADSARPAALLERGIGLEDSRFTYALGKLALFSDVSDYELGPEAQLTEKAFRFLSIANPNIAPYGAGAKQVLQKLRLWQGIQKQIVRGENVSQALQFVLSKNAQLGFVALAQLNALDVSSSSYWLIPQEYYQPLEQQVLLITDTPVGQQFLAFLRSEQIRALIQQQGYGVPDV